MHELHHYPDIERCKKLTDIGFPTTELAIHGTGDYVRVLGFVPKDARKYYVKCCPSVMEMLDVIPWAIERNDGPRFFTIDKHSPIDNEPDHYDVGFMDETDTLLYSYSDTLPNALADLIFWLYENNYIKF